MLGDWARILIVLDSVEESVKRDGVFRGWLFFLYLLAVQASASAHGVLPCSGPAPVAPWSSARRGGLRTECHTNADFVRALAYGVCLDAEKPKAYRFLDSITWR
jgi:hypothetical protein